jgi:hypothetical protein
MVSAIEGEAQSTRGPLIARHYDGAAIERVDDKLRQLYGLLD